MVRTGLDVLLQTPDHDVRKFLAGKRVGLVTNYASFASDGRRNIEALVAERVCESLVVFGPEHGYWSDGQYMDGTEDETYGDLRIVSLYRGASAHHLFPTPKDVADVDALVVDLQDVGARFYTFYATMANCMFAAAAVKRPLFVLDRPNPINGVDVEGGLLQPPFISFIGQYPIPIRHGMTIGEMAKWLDATQRIGCNPTVVEMDGWFRTMWWDETGVAWRRPPSPNMPNFETTVVYPGMCLFEGTNVSEARGTTYPFRALGAPWLDEHRLADALNARELPGVAFVPHCFKPAFEKFSGQRCSGVWVEVTNRSEFRPVRTALHAIHAIRELAPDDFGWRDTTYEWANASAIDVLIGSYGFRAVIDLGGPLNEWIDQWQQPLAEWQRTASEFHLYRRAPELQFPIRMPATDSEVRIAPAAE
jgi:uncharacterized protein YbbC (DUF1343 family)